MERYVETKIGACGKTFAIVVYDTTDKPFRVGELNLAGDDIEGCGYSYDYRTEAIDKCSELAKRFISL